MRQRFGDSSREKSQRLHAALALAALGELDKDYLLEAVTEPLPAESRNILSALNTYRETASRQLAARAANETAPEKKARLALSSLALGDFGAARELVQMAPDPTYRTTFIHEVFPQWLVSAAELRHALENTADSALCYSICLGLGLSSSERFSADEKHELADVLL